MALVYADRVQETTVTLGTGTLTLAGPVASFQSFSVIGVGNTTYYVILDTTTNDWEVGLGTVGASTLARTSVLASSNANALVNLAAGTKNVFTSAPAALITTLLTTVGHAAISHTGLPGVPAPEAFTSLVHATTNHTGIAGVGDLSIAAHAATNHTGFTGIGNLATAPGTGVVDHTTLSHTGIPGVGTGDLTIAAHLTTDHAGVPGVIPLKNQSFGVGTLITTSALTIYTLPASTLSADGDSLEIELWFDGNGAGAANYAPLSLGGTNIITSSAAATNTNERDQIVIHVFRTGASAGNYTIFRRRVGTTQMNGILADHGHFGTLAFSWASSQILSITSSVSNRFAIRYARLEKRKAA